MDKLTHQEVESQYPTLFAASIEDKRQHLEAFAEDGFGDSELEEFAKDYLQTFWSLGDFVFLNVWADRGRFNEPTLALHIPTGVIVDAQEGDDDLFNEFWELYMDE
jgi:hypothetical protein